MIGQPWFPKFLDHVAAAGMNAVVVDGKDYSGWLTYPSSIPLAGDTRASSHAVLKSLPALVHVAHERGIRILLRVTCFHDPWMAAHRPDLAIKGVGDWLDPHNLAAQDYILSVVDETLTSGVDEIQLDYVRFPTDNINHADFALNGAKTTDVIAGFVQRVHEHTHAADVPLALDVFGVVAWQRSVDVRATGQDLASPRPGRRGALADGVPVALPRGFQRLHRAGRSPRGRRLRDGPGRGGPAQGRLDGGRAPLDPGLPMARSRLPRPSTWLARSPRPRPRAATAGSPGTRAVTTTRSSPPPRR